MNIYVDFDDCICETAREYSRLAERMFGKHVPYEDIRFFDLNKTFGIEGERFERFMAEGHKPETLLAYEETPGASSVINEWLAAGHEVSVITGRPLGAYEPSRKWLDDHGLGGVPLYCLDKYGREGFARGGGYGLGLEEYLEMKFDYAVEDSPKAFRFFAHLPELRVLVFDRPWNWECELPAGNYRRVSGWEEIRRLGIGGLGAQALSGSHE